MFRSVPACLPGPVLVLVLVVVYSSSAVAPVFGDANLTAPEGHDVTLPCRAPGSGAVRAAEWSRPNLEPKYVFFYRDGQPDETHQHPSYQNRVGLADGGMTDGNLSLIVKKVISTDTGTYECRVKQATGAQRKRSVIRSKPISVVHLLVTQSRVAVGQSGAEQHVSVGLLPVLLISAQIFFIYS